MAALLCACLHTRSYLTERLALPMQLIAECFCIYNDQNTSEAMAYDKSLGFR